MPHLNTEWMMKSLQNLQLSVLIPLVLEDFLNCYNLSCLGYLGFEYDSERPVSDNLLRIVGQALL